MFLFFIFCAKIIFNIIGHHRYFVLFLSTKVNKIWIFVIVFIDYFFD